MATKLYRVSGRLRLAESIRNFQRRTSSAVPGKAGILSRLAILHDGPKRYFFMPTSQHGKLLERLVFGKTPPGRSIFYPSEDSTDRNYDHNDFRSEFSRAGVARNEALQSRTDRPIRACRRCSGENLRKIENIGVRISFSLATIWLNRNNTSSITGVN